jgi:predicted nucleic acid-binding protein
VIALLDNTVLSNFTTVERPDLVRLALGKDAVTSEAAWAELQAGIHIGKLLPQDWSWLPVLSLTEDEKPLYNLLVQRLNAGEASCLAIAATRGYRIFTDDRDARELAAEMRLIDLKALSLPKGTPYWPE